MADVLRFGAGLARFLEHRGLAVPQLAERAGLGAGQLRAVLDGAEPGDAALRALAGALGLHAVDLFALAGVAAPQDLAPLDPGARRSVEHLVVDAVRCPEAQRLELLGLVRAVPQQRRPAEFELGPLAPVSGGPGGAVIRMLRYRNLHLTGMAKVLAFTTPTYLSAATYGVIGRGTEELTPRRITDFAAVLGFDARELAALTGVELTAEPEPPYPAAEYAAGLLWAARRLSAAQAEELAGTARAMARAQRNGGG
ncbi:hypothetical protein [Kitasatospora viridis]|uniref:Helix-turn-helix protein n=1 Tax=Kitasatospora viridis TaxID=281105 RepID=A0A561TSY6_9ACTN|nr:hypothetical protein [Kitasatospora viridis]TWF90218.1 hypothetical protein FHX73_13262 [Kitasatospora viridis]